MLRADSTADNKNFRVCFLFRMINTQKYIVSFFTLFTVIIHQRKAKIITIKIIKKREKKTFKKKLDEKESRLSTPRTDISRKKFVLE